LEFICQQLEQLDVVGRVPDDLRQRDFIINRAMDVRSASLLYLALHIRHDATPLGIFGISLVDISNDRVRQNFQNFLYWR
jgi:hypothetical protein